MPSDSKNQSIAMLSTPEYEDVKQRGSQQILRLRVKTVKMCNNLSRSLVGTAQVF